MQKINSNKLIRKKSIGIASIFGKSERSNPRSVAKKDDDEDDEVILLFFYVLFQMTQIFEHANHIHGEYIFVLYSEISQNVAGRITYKRMETIW